jgi:3-oxoacyl-[acyl-carrier protein] reductase
VCNAGGDIGAGGTDVGRGGRPSPDDAVGIPLPDIRAVLDRNLLSCILCCREAAPEMMARKSGRIITIGSIAGCFGRDDGVIYSVAKAAVNQSVYPRRLLCRHGSGPALPLVGKG